MKLEDLENIKNYHIDNGFLCIELISGDYLRINFNSLEAIKKQFSIPVVVASEKINPPLRDANSYLENGTKVNKD